MQQIIFYQKNGQQLPFDKREEAFCWRLGSLWGVKSFSTEEELKTILQLTKGKHLVFQELGLLEQEWRAIWQRALLLATTENLSLGHLIGSLEGWQKIPIHLRPIPPVREAFEEIARSMNSELIFTLAKQLDPEIVRAVDLVEVDATEKYTFVAYLKDFHTEISSLLLQNRLSALQHLKQKSLQSIVNPEIEEEIAIARRDLFENIDSLALILQNIMHTSPAKGSSFHNKCELLLDSIRPKRSWVDFQLIWHLLLSRFNFKMIAVGDWDEKTAWLASLLNSLEVYIKQQGDEPILAYLHKKRDLPEELRSSVKEQLMDLKALPEPPYGNYNPDLYALLP